MKILPIDSIQVSPSRQRREFDPQKMVELRESIERLGLLHPVVVRREGEATILVAGERRLRAIRELWEFNGRLCFEEELLDAPYVPTVTLGELGAIDAMDAELSENIIRTDLTWQERCDALSRLNQLRLAQNPEFRVGDLAEEVTGRRDGSYHSDTRRALIVARHLDNPLIAKAKDEKEAFKLLKRDEETKAFAAQGLRVGRTFNKSLHAIFLGDCLEWMASLSPASFDVCCTDPPYGMDAQDFGDGAGRLTAIDHQYEDSSESFRSLLAQAAPLISRVCKPAAALYCCCDLDQFFWLRDLFRAQGWYVFRTPLINVKSGSGRVPLPDYGPRRQYETVLFAYRGGKRTNALYSDVIISKGDEQLGHGAQKPVALFQDLLGRHCRPGDSVIDPFCGTGTIFVAAHALKVAATGIEQAVSYYGMAIKRLEDLPDGPL
jgi:DNA modification methylase/ParB-like chromosome segregation protein Spo0J